MRPSGLLIVAATMIAGVGCDRSAKTTAGVSAATAPGPVTDAPERKAMAVDMQMLALTIYLVHDDSGQPPKGVADIEPKMSGGERLVRAIKDGTIVVNRGAPIKAAWWAYEKDAPIKGGFVIVPDPGRRDEMRAKEVSAEEAKKILGR
jgi:hypothetical protein